MYNLSSIRNFLIKKDIRSTKQLPNLNKIILDITIIGSRNKKEMIKIMKFLYNILWNIYNKKKRIKTNR